MNIRTVEGRVPAVIACAIAAASCGEGAGAVQQPDEPPGPTPGLVSLDLLDDEYHGLQGVSPAIGLVNCAQGGNGLERWLELQSLWDDCRARIAAAGFSPDQVRVVWAKKRESVHPARTDAAAACCSMVGSG